MEGSGAGLIWKVRFVLGLFFFVEVVGVVVSFLGIFKGYLKIVDYNLLICYVLVK